MINEILSKINNGEFTVKYDMWFFAGGHTDGDFDRFLLYQNGNEYGEIELNYYNGVYVYINDKCVFSSDIKDEDTMNLVSETLDKAIERDDKELAEVLIKKYGKIDYPRDCGDITREDILKGDFL